MSKTQSPSYHGHSRIISAETPGSSPQGNENHRLKKENARLRSENEQLRRVFDDAVDQFNSQKNKIEELCRELEDERTYRKEFEKQENGKDYVVYEDNEPCMVIEIVEAKRD